MTAGHNGKPRGRGGAAATAEVEAALGNRLLRALRQHAVFALDARGCVSSWSEAAERLTGFAADDVDQRPFELFAPGDGSRDRRSILASAAESGTWQGDTWWRRADGGLARVEEVIHPLDPTGFVVVAREIAAEDDDDSRLHAAGVREAAGLDRENLLRSELQAADRRASFLAEASSILVATSVDFDSTLKALSRLAVSRLAEWCVIHTLDGHGRLTTSEVAHRDPALEARLAELVQDAPQQAWAQAVQTVIDTGRAEILGNAVDGRWLRSPMDASSSELLQQLGRGGVMATPLLGRGRVLGAITFVAPAAQEFGDGELLLAEELGRRAAMALDNARLLRDAQEADRAKADFLAVISHELRTPLNAIMGYSDLMDAEISGQLTDKQRREVDRIRASARHLLQLIEEILSFARLQSGGDELHLELVDAVALLDEAAAMTEPLARARDLEFLVQADVDSVMLETDAGKARQVLVNLLSNAVKFTEVGAVHLKLRRAGDKIVFEVVDTGVGIAAEQVKRIYDPFWQAERPNTRKTGGTGLGLSVSRRYVRLLRGDLDVHSEPGRGTTFTLSLPLRMTGGRQGDRGSSSRA
jgi:PAS domain S-box-containing protein